MATENDQQECVIFHDESGERRMWYECEDVCISSLFFNASVWAHLLDDGGRAAVYIWIIGHNEGEQLVWRQPAANSQLNYRHTAGMEEWKQGQVGA